jgi:hypothetical protein
VHQGSLYHLAFPAGLVDCALLISWPRVRGVDISIIIQGAILKRVFSYSQSYSRIFPYFPHPISSRSTVRESLPPSTLIQSSAVLVPLRTQPAQDSYEITLLHTLSSCSYLHHRRCRRFDLSILLIFSLFFAPGTFVTAFLRFIV